MGDDNDLVVKGIINIGQSFVGAGGGLIDLGRALHVQSFVRTFVVENLDKVIEPCLLLKEVYDLSGETEASNAGTQPCRGITWWADRDG